MVAKNLPKLIREKIREQAVNIRNEKGDINLNPIDIKTKIRKYFEQLLLFIHSVLYNSLWPMDCNMFRLHCPSLYPGVCSSSCPLNQWCHPTISSSVIPFSYLQYFPATGSFTMSWLLASGGQSVGALASVLPMNIQSWFPLGLISLQSKGLSRVFSKTTVRKHQFFGTQPSLWSNSHIHTWLLEKP